MAYLVAHCTRTLLWDHVANLVAAGFGFGNHVAGLPAYRAGPLLGHHVANLVAAGPLFRNHVAYLVAHCAAALLRNHVANLVAVRVLLRFHMADLVAFRPGAGFAHVLRAADLFVHAAGNPLLLAAGVTWALRALFVAAAWRVAAFATAGVIRPGAWFVHDLADRRARNFVRLRAPVTTLNLDGLCVVHWHADVVANLAGAIFPHWLAGRIATGLLFVARLADRVADLAALRLEARLADGVAAGLGFPARLADGVANFLAVVFPARMAHGVATGLRLVARLADRIANLATLRLVAGLADRVATSLGLVARFANRVTNLAAARFGYVLHTINCAIFTHPVPDCSVAGKFFLRVLHAADRLRAALSLLLTVTTAVTRDSAIACIRLSWGKR
jgi:hypothetical protein